MRRREREKIVGKIGEASDAKHGQSVHVRPYLSDEKQLEEIARETGEGKAAIVRRMIRFALSDKQERFGTNRCRERLDWLIEKERQNSRSPDTADTRYDDVLDRVARLEDDFTNASRMNSIFLRELYVMASVSVSTLNILLSRVIQLSSPGGADKEQSVQIADATMAKLIAHAIRDLENCSTFHGVESEDETAAHLYFAKRITITKDRVAENHSSTLSTKPLRK